MDFTTAFLIGCSMLVAVLLLIRRALALRGSGRLAQLAFRRTHGEEVARLLDGSVDPRPSSPWIAIRVAGRPARMVAAPIGRRWMQAGIELADWTIPVEVFHAMGEPPELEVPAGIDEQAVVAIARELSELEVDSVSTIGVVGEVHVARMRFRDVADLPARVRSLGALLERLEGLVGQEDAGRSSR